MGVRDFLLCTPIEFRHIYDSWSRMREAERRERWEQARMMCLCQLQPWSRKELHPQDVMRFEWEKNEKKDPQDTESHGRAELMERYRRAREQFGLH